MALKARSMARRAPTQSLCSTTGNWRARWWAGRGRSLAATKWACRARPRLVRMSSAWPQPAAACRALAMASMAASGAGWVSSSRAASSRPALMIWACSAVNSAVMVLPVLSRSHSSAEICVLIRRRSARTARRERCEPAAWGSRPSSMAAMTARRSASSLGPRALWPRAAACDAAAMSRSSRAHRRRTLPSPGISAPTGVNSQPTMRAAATPVSAVKSRSQPSS